MRLGKLELKVRHPRIWLGLIGACVCVAVVALLWQTYFVQPTNPPARPPAQPSVAPQPLIPSSYEAVRRRFGLKGQLVVPNTTGAPRLVMLKEDGVEVSSAIVHVSSSWQPAIANEIESVAPGNRTVRIRLFNNIDTLQYGQAFILAPHPEVVYSFLSEGPGKAQLVSTTVAALSKR